ncbi:sigma-70 family RNA polymerase sigma factor [Streptosporangium fragile]|uniref:Sigma-70 family RNA polymerase sigma factor n=1 Tax=Streptosporangium fragile TaxID=46186 RepID=A0ABP6I5D0_9ACTN
MAASRSLPGKVRRSDEDKRDSHNDHHLEELVELARGGNQRAWNSLLRRFLPLVQLIARRYELQRQDIEDVNQVVWLKLLQHIKSIRDTRSLAGWIATTSRNECVNVIRRSRPLVLFGDWPSAFDAAHTISYDWTEEATAYERKRALARALEDLSSQHRELLNLLAANPPLSYAEIGKRMGMPVGSIGPTRLRAIARLRESMGTTGAPERRREPA